MIGINNFFNQPLAIEGGYLNSLIANLFLHYSGLKNENLHQLTIDAEAKFTSKIKKDISEDFKTPVVVNIIGAIVKYSTWYNLGTTFYTELLEELDNHPNVSGIILNIDSGGGMVSGTAELCHVIKNLTKATISYTAGYQCSAAQDIASACDYHMASPYADLLGSISTMLSFQDFSKLFEKYGATIYELYASQSSEKNKEYRDLIAGDEKAYQERLDTLASDFIERIKANHSNIKDDGHIFKGKTYTPHEALEIGLIDQLGSLKDALNQF